MDKLNDEEKGKMVSISEADFKELLRQNAEMISALKQNGSNFVGVRRNPTKERNVSVLCIDGKPVIGYVNRGGDENRPTFIYEGPNPDDPKDRILFVDVILKGMDKAVKLNYVDFLREAERKICKVLKTEEKPWSVEQGEVEVTEQPDGEYYTRGTGIYVPAGTKGVTRFYTVEMPDHSELTLHERYVNIAR